MPLLVLSALFIGVPLLEIALFIQIGGLIGLWPTLLVVLLTGIAGAFLLRQQGLGVAAEIDRSVRDGGLPAQALLSALFIGIAGCLLLTPGFFTDTIGFLLFVPGFRRWAGRQLISTMRHRVTVQTAHFGEDPFAGHPNPRGGNPSGPVIDGEAVDVSDIDPERPDSPWRNS
ncbi:MAG: FxsA family protein [Pseudomonadota bacterium]